jgi:fibronectin-binding autotransporter adhesin
MNTLPLSLSRRLLILQGSIAVLVANVVAPPTRGANLWDGGGGNGNWSTGLNWDNDVVPAFPQAITFDGNLNRITNNDLADVAVSGITFGENAGEFTIGGNAINLNGGIVIQGFSTAIHRINAPLIVASTQSIDTGTGELVIGPGANGTGVISGAGGLTMGGFGRLTLGAVNTYAGPTTLVSGTLAYTADNAVPTLDFGIVPTATAVSTTTANLDLTSANLTVGTLNVQTNSTSANAITIGAGKTLTVNGAVTIGPNATYSDTTATVRTVLNVTGNAFVINGGAGHLTVGVSRAQTGVGGDPLGTLDLTGLSTFRYTGTTGELRIGGGNVAGVMRLAAVSNEITAAQVRIGDSGVAGGNNNGGTSSLSLGLGTNVINANTITIGAVKSPGTVTFQSPESGSIVIAGLAGGTSKANITIGSASSATASGVTSQLQLDGHQAIVQAGTLIIGRMAGSTGGTGAGNVTFDTGTFTVDSLQLGVNSSGTAPNGSSGTFTLGGAFPNDTATGVLTVNNQFLLANRTTTNASSPASGTFVINGGTAVINTDILDGSTTGDATLRNTTLTLAGGTLNMTGHNIGSATAPITTVNFFGGTLMNVNSINGDGGVAMAGLETLFLDGTNNYTGGTTISFGTVQVGKGGNSGTLGTGTVTNDGTLVFNRTGILTVNDPIVGTGVVRQNGGGTIVLGGTNTYSGLTEINAGTLAITGSVTSPITVKSGGTLAGAGQGPTTGRVGNVTMEAGSHLRPGATGDVGDTGKITIGNLTLTGGNIAVDLGTTSDLVEVTGAATFSGATTITPNPAAPGGTYTILTAGTLTLTVQPTVVSPTTTRKTFTADYSTANTIKLVVGGNSKALTWTGAANGVWDLGATGTVNWTDGTIAERFFDADSVVFGDGPANRNVTITGITLQPASVTVNNAAGNDYTFGGTGGIGGGATLVKSGAGALTLNSANSYVGNTTLNGGVLNLNHPGALGTGALAIAGGSIDNTSGAPVTLAAGNDQEWNANVVFVGTNSLNLGTGAVAMAGDRVVTVNGSELTVGGPIAGTGSLTKAGTGRLTLAGANTFAGGVTLSAGTLNLNHAGAVGTGPFTIEGGSIDNTSGAPVTLNATEHLWNSDVTFLGSNPLNLGAGAVSFTDNRTVNVVAGNLTVGGLISNVFGISKAGVGTLTLAAANTYTGATTVTAGTIVVTNAAAGASSLGSLTGEGVTVAAGAAIDLAGNTTANSLNFGTKIFSVAGTGVGGTGAITNSGSVGQQNALQRVVLTANTTFGGTGRFDIRGGGSSLDLGGHTLTKTGTNQFTLVATAVTEGNIVVNQGIFAIETTSSIPNNATGSTITYNAGTTAQFFNLSGNITRPMVFNGGVTMGNASAQISTVGSDMLLNGDLTFTNLNGSAGALTLNGNLTETGGARGITKNGPTLLTLAGNVSHTGVTMVNAGTLAIAGSMANQGGVIVNSGGTFSVSGSLTGTGAVNLNGGLLSVTGTQVPAGIINVNTGGTLSGTGSVGEVTMFAGGNLRPGINGLDASIGTLALGRLTIGGGDLRLGLVTPDSSDRVTVANSVAFTGASTITPTGGGPGTYIVLTAGSPIDYGAAGVNRPTIGVVQDPLARPTSYVLDTATNPSQIALTISGGAKTLTWTGTSDTVWSPSEPTSLNWKDAANAPESFFNNDAVVFGDGPTNRDVFVLQPVAPSAILFSNSTGSDYLVSGAAISGNGTLRKEGTGAVSLESPNTYTGGTVLAAGKLNVNNATALGTGLLTITGGSLDTTGFGPLVVTANNPQSWVGDFTFTGTNDLSLGTGAVALANDIAVNVIASNLAVGGVVSGSFGLTKTGAGTLTLTGASTFAGPTVISAGTVRVGNATGANSSLGSLTGGPVTIENGATLDLSGNLTAQALNFGAKQFVVEGTGVGGLGAIFNAGVSQFNALQRVQLTGNATFGGSARFDVRGTGSILDLAGHTLTKIGGNQFSLVNTTVTDGNIVVNEGIFSIEAATSIPDLGTGTKITYNEGTSAWFFSNTAAESTVTRPMLFNGSGITVGPASSNNNSVIGSPMTLNGDVTFRPQNNTTNNTLTLTGGISETGTPRVITKSGVLSLVLAGPSTYTGGTVIEEGRLQVGDGGIRGTLGAGNVTNQGTLAFNRSDELTVANVITGGGAVEQLGTGRTILSGNSTYTGPTNVLGGTLLVSGNISGTSGVSVASGGSLGGAGKLTTTGNIVLASGGALAPGLSGAGTLELETSALGVLDVVAAVIDAGAFKFELGTSSDRVRLVNGSLSIGTGELDLSSFAFANAGGFGEGTYTLFQTDSPITGTLGPLKNGAVLGLDATLSFADNNTDLVLTVIPEPATSATVLLGALALSTLRRRRR